MYKKVMISTSTTPTFYADIMVGNRITIPKDIMDVFKLKGGDKLEVGYVRKIK